MKKLLLIVLGFSLPFGIFAQEDEGSDPIKYNLAELLSLGTGSSQNPLTREELREQSDVIANGIISSITPGREFHATTYQPVPIAIKTAIFEVDVLYIEKGLVEDDTLYFEYIVGAIPVEILDHVKPQMQIEFFLKDSGLDEESYRVIDSESRTKGFDHHLYYPTRDIALLEQIGSDRRYDIRSIIQEIEAGNEVEQVDGDLPSRVSPDIDAWENQEELFLPEEAREQLRQ